MTIQTENKWRDFISVFLLGLICILLSIHKPIGDFGNYYYASKLFLEHKWSIAIYQDLALFNRLAAEMGSVNHFLNYTPVPPFSLLFYTPLAMLSPVWAKLGWNLITLILFAFSWNRFIKTTNTGRFSFLIPWVFFFPFLSNIYQGQAYLLCASLMLESWMADQKNKPLASGLWLSLAILLKIFPAILLLYFILRKNYRTAFSVVVFCISGILISIVVSGFSLNLWYYTSILPRLMNNEITGIFEWSNRSILTLLNHCFVEDKNIPVHPFIFQFPFLVPIIKAAVDACILGLLWSARKSENLTFMALVLLGGNLIQSYNTTYAMLLFMPVFVIPLLNTCNKWQTVLIYFLSMLVYFLSAGIGLPEGFKFTALAWHAILLIVFFRNAGLKFQIKPAILVFTVLCILQIVRYEEVSPRYFPLQANKGILYHSNWNSDSVSLYKTLGSREIKENFKIKARLSKPQSLLVENNCIVYQGKIIENSHFTKKEPVLWNDTAIVFLADYHQGIGMYKIFYLPLQP